MVQSLGRVVIAAAALNVVATLARPSFGAYDLEARDLEGQEVSTYNRRYFDAEDLELEAREFDDYELDARELEDSELEARGFDDVESLETREPEPLHIPFFSNWNAGRKQRNKDLQWGKKERLEADQAAGIDATRRDLSDWLQTREPEPLHVPFFSNWNAGRKQRKKDREQGEKDRLQADQAAGIDTTRRYISDSLETREPEPKIPFFTNWNAGRKQRNADRKKGKQDRLAAEKGATGDDQSTGEATRRELDFSDEFEARDYDDVEFEAREYMIDELD